MLLGRCDKGVMIFKVKLVYLHFTLLLNYSKSFRLFCGNKNNFYPPWWDPPASSLTHYQMSSGLCIILFILSFLDFFFRAFSQGFITHVLGEGFHTLIKSVLFSSITNVGHHNPPPLRPNVLAGTHSFLDSTWDRHQIHLLWGQRPYWHIVWCLVFIPFVTTQMHH